MGKIAEKKNEKYKKLISAAYELLENNGSIAISIDSIVKKAGVAKGTFYLYFNDKIDLITKLITEKAAEQMNSEIEVRDIKDYDDFAVYAKKYIDFLVDFFEKNRTVALLVDKNVHICVKSVIENREGTIKEVYDKILQYFERNGFSPEELSIKMYLCIDMIVSACCNAILRDMPCPLKDVKTHIYDIVIMSVYGAEQKKRIKSNNMLSE